MAPITEPSHSPGNELTVHGTLPAGLSGQLLGIGPDVGAQDGVVHSIELDAGRIIGHRCRLVLTDAVARRLGTEPTRGPRGAGPDIVASNIVAFGGSILALGGALAYELTSDLATLRRVDVAGQSRGVAPFPKPDPVTGELHVLAVGPRGAHAHVVVSAGALTRRSRPIAGVASRVTDLAISRHHVVYAADGFVGVAARDAEAQPIWIATGGDAALLVHAHDVGETVVVLTLTPALETWTLHPASRLIRRDVLDPTPRRFARTADHRLDQAPRFVWTSGDDTVDKHDLTSAGSVTHIFRQDRIPGDLAFVADPARADDADGGWLVGFVHHASGNYADLVILDAADIARPAIATVRIPQCIPRRLHSTWIPSTHQ